MVELSQKQPVAQIRKACAQVKCRDGMHNKQINGNAYFSCESNFEFIATVSVWYCSWDNSVNKCHLVVGVGETLVPLYA